MNEQDDAPFEAAPMPEGGYIQLPVPGHPYSAIRLPVNPEWTAVEVVEIAKMLVDALDAQFPQQEAPQYMPAPQQGNTYAPRQQPQNGYQQRQQAPQQAVVFDNVGNPCCGMHKTREGFPRPMRQWDDGGFSCTAKKRDGSYCTNKYRPTGEVERVRDPY